MPLRRLLIAALFLTQQLVLAQSPAVPGEILVSLPSPAHADRLLQTSMEWTGAPDLVSERLGIWRFHVTPGKEDSTIQQVSSLPYVGAAQRNHILAIRETFPDDPDFDNQWNMYNDGSSGGLVDADIDAELAWDLSTGGWTSDGDTIVVAVVDDGFYLPHNDLRFRKNHSEIPDNGIDDDGNGFVDDFDGWNSVDDSDALPDFSHGTHVSGIVGAKGDNFLGVSGVNWYVQVLPLSIGAGSVIESNVLECYGYILVERERYDASGGSEGSFVVSTNASFGIDNADPDAYPLWCSIYDSLGHAGILSTGATANSNVDVDVVGDMPTGCASEFLITVNNTNKEDEKSSSAFGLESIDMGAPGALVYSTVSSNGFAYQSGTSMAAPHVAGAVALLWSYACDVFLAHYKFDPAAGAAMLKSFLMEGTDPLADLDGITVTGGRLNVYNAMLLMEDHCDYLADIPALEGTEPLLHPNPATDVVRLSGWTGGPARVRLMDAMGRTIKRWDAVQPLETISISSLDAGWYLVEAMMTDGQAWHLPLVIR